MKRVSLSLVFLATLVASAAAQSGSGVYAYYRDYNLINNDYNFEALGVSCAKALANTTVEWRKKYGWTGYCTPHADLGEDMCGKCISVTNTANGANEKVRVFHYDSCGVDHLDLDLHTSFAKIDDGNGVDVGHLVVDYEFVESCGDEPEPIGPGETNVHATFANFDVKKHNWSLSAAGVECATYLPDVSYEWLKKYGWTGYCNTDRMPDACGKCLKVTNTETETKDEIKVRIVDACSDHEFHALNMDYDYAFEKIDTNKIGYLRGYLVVDYNFVECGYALENKNVHVAAQ
ncbi:Barwin [Corchorus olitorius]|uniref:Barwin n=1 Tax=Corchorus olitorius TaxID=93759 RepID=A0A1R3JNF1_9ROSI|nr:Barwin [Corchorus olitorius]